MGLISFAKGLKQAKEQFMVKIQPDVLEALKQKLRENGKDAVRLEVSGFGWGGPTFEIVLDEQKDDDIVYDADGVKFVVESSLKYAVSKPEIIMDGNEIKVASEDCCS